jgi:hypothetical protein
LHVPLYTVIRETAYKFLFSRRRAFITDAERIIAMRVKGTLLLDYIRMVRANKEGAWNDYLTPEDWEIINGQVLSSQWYPYESFRRIAYAAFKIIAKSDLDAARAYGRFNIQNLLEVYKTIIQPGDPAGSIKKLSALRRTFFQGEVDTLIEDQGPGWLVYKVIPPKEGEDFEKFEAFCQTIAGNLEEISERAGGKNISVKVEADEDAGRIRVEWE